MCAHTGPAISLRHERRLASVRVWHAMLRLACSLCAIGGAAPLVSASTFVRGAGSGDESGAGTDVAAVSPSAELQQAQRIGELEHQLEELRRSLDVCTANSHAVSAITTNGDYGNANTTTAAAAAVAARARRSQLQPVGGLVSPPVEDLVVVREFTSYNWGNGTLHQRASNDNNDKKTEGGRHRRRRRRRRRLDATGEEDNQLADQEQEAEDEEDPTIIGVCLASTSKSKKHTAIGQSVGLPASLRQTE
jgi:hypothetical protein